MIKMRLHILLAENKMNQKELSEITGISKNTIGSYCNENNKHIVKSHLDIFCKLFKCKLTDIINFEE